MCSEEFKMTDCEAYGNQVFKPHPSWDQARAHSEKEYYETFTTTHRAYDTGYEVVTTTGTGYEAVTRM